MELERREILKKRYNLKFYGYGANLNPFSCRVFCGLVEILVGFFIFIEKMEGY
jgi:hypothetical protein